MSMMEYIHLWATGFFPEVYSCQLPQAPHPLVCTCQLIGHASDQYNIQHGVWEVERDEGMTNSFLPEAD
jgi:hypothetical protein